MQLVQPDIRIIPYLRDQDRGEVLYHAWRMVEDSGEQDKLFWNLPGTHDLPWFTDYMTTGRQLFVMTTEQDLVGLAWAEDIRPGHQAFFSFFVRPAYRGRTSVAACRQMTRAILDGYDLQQLWAMTPWKPAKMLGLITGARCVATLSNYAQGHDVFLLQWMR